MLRKGAKISVLRSFREVVNGKQRCHKTLLNDLLSYPFSLLFIYNRFLKNVQYFKVTHITFNQSSNVIAQSSEDKEVKLWDPRNLEMVAQLPRKNHIQMHCEFIDDKLLASTSNGFNGYGCEISVRRKLQLLRELKGHEGSVPCIANITQQVTLKKLMMSVSMDKSIRIWNIEDGGKSDSPTVFMQWEKITTSGNSRLHHKKKTLEWQIELVVNDVERVFQSSNNDRQYCIYIVVR
ncbi:unnamed protein product [Strongylus vulgaris]|uniref:Uncharacterized protein n=1 Tax=Strongylus vulgaris TaxID=40348 RepID=A0A3P7I756_STRVU|nr:unnamed protein product [Strongylus vulgaris]